MQDAEAAAVAAARADATTALKGANTFTWDFRYAGANVLPDAVFQGNAAGPLAPPGTYRVELTVDGKTYTQSFKLVKDPRLPYTDAELEEQFQFMKKVSDRLEQTMSTVRRIREMRKRAEDMVAQAKKDGKNAAQLDQALKALERQAVSLSRNAWSNSAPAPARI